ncbi:MAG: TetR/AcrR family transcriptional regulator [Pseudomonadales bacterium]|nr:TetR/AcrR family transcriptional regulator [Pseudomonadales bacterium]
MKAKDARAARSHRALLDAGLELLLQKPNATLTEVATHAGVGRATLYRHFDTREALVKALVLECLQVTEEVVAPIKEQNLGAKAQIEATLRAVVPLADRFHFLLSLWSIASDDEQVNQIYEDQLNQLHQIIEAAKQEGSIKAGLDSGWIVSIIDGMLYSAWWMIGQGHLTEEQATEHVLETLFAGVGGE